MEEMGWIIVGIIVISVILKVIAVYVQSVCEKCKKGWALSECEKVETKRERISKLEEHQIRDKNGQITGTREERVYGEKIHYEITYQCKYCGYKCKKNTYEEKY